MVNVGLDGETYGISNLQLKMKPYTHNTVNLLSKSK